MTEPFEKTETVKRLEELRTRGARANRKMVGEAEMTQAFVAGNQWLEYDWRSGGLVDIDTEGKFEVDNKMLNAHRRWMQYMFKERPVITCHEGGHELKDAEVAAVSSSICDFIESNNGWRKAREKQAAWAWMAGVGSVMPVLRESLHKTTTKPIMKFTREHEDADGRISYLDREVKEIPEKDIAFQTLNPLNTYLFPLDADEWEKVEYIVYADVVSKEWIVRNVPEDEIDMDNLEPVDKNSIDLEANKQLKKLAPGNLWAADMEIEDDRFLLIKYWERPSRVHPFGRHQVVVGGQEWIDTKLPYVDIAREIDPNDTFNITMGIFPFLPIKLPGTLISPSLGSQLRAPQIRINEILTDIARNRGDIAKNKLIYEEGSLSDEQWTDKHGERVPVPAGTTIKPQFVQAPPLVGAEGELNRANFSMEDASGMTSVLRGHNPTQARAAFQLEILREESMTLMNADGYSMEGNYELQARFVLGMAKKVYSPERVIEIAGRDRQGMALTFKTAVINTDVRVKQGSMIPRNHALTEAKLVELWRDGAFVDPETGKPNADQFWAMSSLGTLNRAIDGKQRQTNRAVYEGVLMLLYGEPVEPFEHEDHHLHINQHLADMARPGWYEADHGKKALMLTHIELHREELAEQLAPQAGMDDFPIPGMLDAGPGGAPMPGAASSGGPFPGGSAVGGEQRLAG